MFHGLDDTVKESVLVGGGYEKLSPGSIAALAKAAVDLSETNTPAQTRQKLFKVRDRVTADELWLTLSRKPDQFADHLERLTGDLLADDDMSDIVRCAINEHAPTFHGLDAITKNTVLVMDEELSPGLFAALAKAAVDLSETNTPVQTRQKLRKIRDKDIAEKLWQTLSRKPDQFADHLEKLTGGVADRMYPYI